MNSIPVVLVIIANDDGKSLRQLNSELDGIKQALHEVLDQAHCKFDFVADASPERLVKALRRHRHNPLILHYAGHGSADAIFVHSKYGETKGQDLAAFLANFDNIQLLFLNACLTLKQVMPYQQSGIKRVIATNQAVHDNVARQFSIDFYKSLASGADIATAFEEAQLSPKLSSQSPSRGFEAKLPESQSNSWEYHSKLEEAWRFAMFQQANTKFLSQAPPLPPTAFIGRASDLLDVHQQLYSSKPLVLVNGIGGVGKTTLAQAYWHRYVQGYLHAAWVECSDGLLTGLQQSELIQELQLDLKQVQGEDAFYRLFNKQMSNYTGPNLLIIDNVNDEKDIRLLQSIPNWQLLITSRVEGKFPRIQSKKVGLLSSEMAKALFISYYQESKESLGEADATSLNETLLEKLLVVIGYHTLTIEVLAKNLASEYYEYNLEQLCHHLEEKGLLQLPDTWQVATEYGTATPQEIISSMYDELALPEDLQRTLLQLSALPAIFIPLKHLEQIFGQSKSELVPTLEKLVKQGWLEKGRTEDGIAFKFHQVLQEVVRKGEQTSYKIMEPLIQNLRAILGGGHNKEVEKKLSFRPYFYKLIKSIKGHHLALAYLSERASRLLSTLGFMSEAGSLSDLAIEHYKHFEEIGLGYMYMNRAYIFSQLGKIEKSITFEQKAVSFFEGKIKQSTDLENYKFGLHQAYTNLGKMLLDYDRINQAIPYHLKGIELAKSMYQFFPESNKWKSRFSVSEWRMGTLRKKQGRLDEAINHYTTFNKLSKEIFESNPQEQQFKTNFAISHQKLGEVFKELAKYDKAFGHYLQFQKLLLELCESFPHDNWLKHRLATAYYHLGKVEKRRNNLNESLEHFQALNRLMLQHSELISDNYYTKRDLAISYVEIAKLYDLLDYSSEKIKTQLEQAILTYKQLWQLSKGQWIQKEIERLKQWIENLS